METVGRTTEEGFRSEIVAFYEGADTETLALRARELCVERHGRGVLLRGLIEYSNRCACDCLYCGIRRSNARVARYRLEPEEILEIARKGYRAGLRSFVLQGGEDPEYARESLPRSGHRPERRHPGQGRLRPPATRRRR